MNMTGGFKCRKMYCFDVKILQSNKLEVQDLKRVKKTCKEM